MSMKWYIITKRTLVYGALIFALAVGAFTFSGHKILQASGTPRKIPVYCVGREDKKISVSFDAAWGNEDTEALIEILAARDVKATFFVVGAWVDKYPESVKALHEAGHEIQSHSDSHPHMPKLSREDMAKEIQNTADKIEAVTGVHPTLFRPPYGEYSNTLIEVLESQNHTCIQWDVDSLDWKNPTPEKITSTVTKKVKSGSIILFHNAAQNTPAALPGILKALQADGYEFVKISQLIYTDNYTIDHAGVQNPVRAEG